jgi:hypothetical protein
MRLLARLAFVTGAPPLAVVLLLAAAAMVVAVLVQSC